jgi:hypothetical protein
VGAEDDEKNQESKARSTKPETKINTFVSNQTKIVCKLKCTPQENFVGIELLWGFSLNWPVVFHMPIEREIFASHIK